MVDIVTIGVVLGGLVLLFAGAALSVYGVVLLGFVVGGGGGYLLAPSVAPALGLEGTLAAAAGVAGGALLGGILGYVLLSFTVAALGFVVGAFVGYTALSQYVVTGEWYVEVGFALAVGAGLALLGMLLTRSTLIVITSVVGAAFASTTLTVAEFQSAADTASIDPLLVDLTSPVFFGLVVLGVLSQIGLFKLGYVAKLARILPGWRVIPSRRGEEAESA